MYDEQDQPVAVVTPFHDADARLQGHTCDTPPPPPPPPPPSGKGSGSQGGGATEGQGKSGAGQGETGKQQGGAGKAQGGAGKAQGGAGTGAEQGPSDAGKQQGGQGAQAGEGGLGVGVGSDVEPGSSGDRVEKSPPGSEGPSGEQPGTQEPAEEGPGAEEQQPGPAEGEKAPPKSNVPAAPKPKPEKPSPGESNLTHFFGFCEFLLDCPVNQWPVEFEEMPGFALGWMVLPGANVHDPRGTLAITDPPNPSAILTVVRTSGGAIEIYQTDDGQKTLVGRGKASSAAGMIEVTSGILFEQLRKALPSFIAKKRHNPAHSQKYATRFHLRGIDHGSVEACGTSACSGTQQFATRSCSLAKSQK